MGYVPSNTGKVFDYAHYRAMGMKAAEYRRQERLLLGKPAYLIRRDWQRWDALLFGAAR